MKPNACPKPPQAPSTGKLDETLGRIGFAEGVREICQRAYADAASSGRPGIDPAVYFKMLMIGFFENLASERSIASRCADSLFLRKLVHRNTAHVLDQGGLRRPPSAGNQISSNDSSPAAPAFDLSLLMRKMTTCGTPKQRLAGANDAFFALTTWLMRVLSQHEGQQVGHRIDFRPNHSNTHPQDTPMFESSFGSDPGVFQQAARSRSGACRPHYKVKPPVGNANACSPSN